MYKIFLVEDDPIIAGAVKEHLESWGYLVACAEDFKNVMAEFVAFDPQLVLMDITLPFFDGYHWCGEIRKVSRVPVIFLSSAADKINIIMAVSMGGDDFLAKPFDLSVLTAKVQAMLRRAYDFSAGSRLIEHRGAILNCDNETLTFQERTIPLTRNEFRILQILMENRGKVVTREAVMTRLWESDSYVDDNTLTVNINRLRKKLGEAGLEGMIVTKKGTGYFIS